MVLAPISADVLGGVLRQRALPALQSITGLLQSGSLPGGGVEAPSMAVRAVLAYNLATAKSVGLLFLDVKAAFYWYLSFALRMSHATNEVLEALLVKAGTHKAPD